MAITRDRYEVAFLDDNGQVAEHEIEVWGVDILRGEQESRRAGYKFSVIDHQAKMTVDVGDTRSREAMEVWAACVRLGLYNHPAVKWRTEDYVGANKLTSVRPEDAKPAPEAVDPTQPEDSTTSDSA